MSAFGENLKRSESEHHITLILLECVDVAETREFMSERERERECPEEAEATEIYDRPSSLLNNDVGIPFPKARPLAPWSLLGRPK